MVVINPIEILLYLHNHHNDLPVYVEAIIALACIIIICLSVKCIYDLFKN